MTDLKMRAKVRVGAVIPFLNGEGGVSQERLVITGVAKSGGYPADGSDEENTFAKFTPSLSLDILIANPSLIGTFEAGDTFYLDFVPAPK